MDKATQKKLIDITSQFYQTHATSFSNTRNNPWEGWQRVLGIFKEVYLQDKPAGELTTFDLAAGNLRFEHFLQENLTKHQLNMYALDNCEALLPENFTVQFQHFDILSACLHDSFSTEDILAPASDLAVSFGFMHHVPGHAMQNQILNCLIEKTKSGGLIAVTFWQFMRDEKRRNKQICKTQEAIERFELVDMGDNDYVIGWQDEADAYRYAHNFTDAEITDLIEPYSRKIKLMNSFSADGRSHDLNKYIVLQKL